MDVLGPYQLYSSCQIYGLMVAYMADQGYVRDDATEIADFLQAIVDDHEGSYELFIAGQGSKICTRYGETLASFVFEAVRAKCALNE